MKRLGVNIDHIATIRNARGEHHPDPFFAAKFVKKSGANSITIHLREDRRHINDGDAKKICSIKNLLVNLEVSTNSKMINSALKLKPNFVCIVPENRKEITTEGGLNLKKNKTKLEKIISRFKKKNIRTSLFINPSLKDIKLSKELKTDCIEQIFLASVSLMCLLSSLKCIVIEFAPHFFTNLAAKRGSGWCSPRAFLMVAI